MKQGKLFGKFSVIDAIALGLVILLIVALGVRLAAFRSADEAEKTPAEQKYIEQVCTVEIRFSGINGYLQQDALKEGDTLTVSGKKFGTVQSVVIQPATVFTTLADGSVVTSERQDAYNYTVTVQATLFEKENLLRDSKNNVIAVGKGLSCYTKLFAAKGVVLSVKRA